MLVKCKNFRLAKVSAPKLGHYIICLGSHIKRQHLVAGIAALSLGGRQGKTTFMFGIQTNIFTIKQLYN